MESTFSWRQAPFSISFTEKDQALKSANIETRISYADFLALVHQLTKETAHQLPGLPVVLEFDEGLSLRHGPWWYRFVHRQEPRTVSTATGWGAAEVEPWKRQWQILSNLETFQIMKQQFVAERQQAGSWIEIKHQLQKERDEGHTASESYRRPGPLVVDPRRPPQVPQVQDNDDPAVVGGAGTDEDVGDEQETSVLKSSKKRKNKQRKAWKQGEKEDKK